MKFVAKLATCVLVMAAVTLPLSSIAEARCGGANGYCTRARKKRAEEERKREQCASLRSALQQLNRHSHPTLVDKERDHKLMTEIKEEISWVCR